MKMDYKINLKMNQTLNVKIKILIYKGSKLK